MYGGAAVPAMRALEASLPESTALATVRATDRWNVARRLPSAARKLPWKLPRNGRLAVTVLVGTQLLWFLWWAAYYPGLISFDSVMYTWQVTTGHWASDHSVLYDAGVWLALHAPGRLALLTLSQTSAMSAALAYAAVSLRELGVPGRWTGCAAVAVAVVPSTATFVIFVWKDVPFTISAVVVCAAAARLVARRNRPGSARRDLVPFCAGLLGLGLFRDNGLGVALIAGLLVLPALPGLRARVGASTATAVLVPLVCQLWLYPALGVKQPPRDSVFAINYSDVAVAYQRAPSLFSPADIAVLTEVAPMTTWKQGADCYSADALTNTAAPFDHAAAERLNGELLGMWARVLEKRPDIVLGARICRAHIAWAPTSNPAAEGAATIIAPLERSPDLWGWTASPRTADPRAGHIAPNGRMVGSPYLPALRGHPLSAGLNRAGTRLDDLFRLPRFDWLFWRGATWCYLAYGALAWYAIRHRRPAVFALGGVLLGLQLTLVAANPAELFRYNVVPLFVGPLCLGLVAGRGDAASLRTRRSARGARSRRGRNGRG